MSCRIGLLADIHASAAPLEEALALFAKRGVERILCAGDIAGYGDALTRSVELLIEAGCEAVSGNHDRWHLEDRCPRDYTPAETWLAGLPSFRRFSIEGRRLYLVHARPPDHDRHGIKLLDETGELIPAQKKDWRQRLRDFDSDVLIVGHTHQVFCERLGHLQVVNPGSPCFNHSCAILSLPQMQFEVFALSGKAVLKSWNWGSFLAGQSR